MNIKQLICILTGVIIFFSSDAGIPAFSLAKNEKTANTSTTAPADTDRLPKGAIQIKSDVMEAKDQDGVVVFTGNVIARQDDLTIDTDRLDVFYQKQAKNNKADNEAGKRAIDKIVATGHVRITKAARVATGEKAVYEKHTEKITISGSAQVWEGQNRIKGETIIFYVNEERSVVQSNGRTKVEAVVIPSN